MDGRKNFTRCCYFGTIINIKKRRSAIRILPLLAFNDILIYFVLFAANVINISKIRTLANIGEILHIPYYLADEGLQVILIISLCLFVFAFCFSLAKSDIFFSIIFSLEGVVLSTIYIWRNSTRSSYGRIVLAFSLVLSIVWVFICAYSSLVTKGTKRNTSFYSFVVSFLIICFNSYFANNSKKKMNAFFSLPSEITNEFSRKMLPWWLTIVMIGFSIGVGFLIFVLVDDKREDDVRHFADCKFYCAVATLTLLTKIILTNYFAYSLIMYIGVLIMLYADIRNDYKRLDFDDKSKRYYDSDDFFFGFIRLIFFVICGIALVQIAENSLYLVLIPTLIIVYMLYKLLYNFFNEFFFDKEDINSVLVGLPKSYNMTIIVLAIILEASLTFYYRLSISNLILLAIMLIIILLVSMLLKRKPPKSIVLPEMKTVKWCMTLFVIVICIILSASSGAKINTQYNSADKVAELSVSVSHKNKIQSIEYKWDNSILYEGYQLLIDGEQPEYSAQQALVSGKKCKENLQLPVKGEYLTLLIIDSNGVQTKRTLWYPIWFSASNKK